MRRESMTQFKKLCVLCLTLAVSSAWAADGTTTKGVQLSGNVNTGFAYTWQPLGAGAGTNQDTQFIVDNATVKLEANISDTTKLVFTNAISLLSAETLTAEGYYNSNDYYSQYKITSGDGRFVMSNLDAYVEHKFSDGFKLAFGNMKTPWGLESMVDRWDVPSYYYSYVYFATMQFGWDYDTGLKLTLSDVIPGKIELSIVDGRANSTDIWSPAGVIRYSIDYKNGDFSITPEVSAYLGKWSGGPDNLGISAGAWIKYAQYFANLEFQYTSMATDTYVPNSQVKIWEAMLEPGVELGGIATVSAKVEVVNQTIPGGSANTDMNIGGAITHDYNNGEFRIRLAYEHGGLLNKFIMPAASASGQAPVNDLRLLFGTKF
jgi:hypothetical protein